jgi:hypothetical protein
VTIYKCILDEAKFISVSERGQKWLVIADNLVGVKTLSQFLPADRGCVIITTRNRRIGFKNLGDCVRIELECLGEDESLHLFRNLQVEYRQADDINDEEDVAHRLLQQFDGHPLAIEQLAAYVAQNRLTLAETLKRLDLKMTRIRGGVEGRNTHHSLETLWALQFEDVQKKAAGSILGILSLLCPENIPITLFESEDYELLESSIQHCEHEEE